MAVCIGAGVMVTVYIEDLNGYVEGYGRLNNELITLWTINSAEDLNPDDESGEWCFFIEGTSETKWFDTKAEAIEYARGQRYE